MNKIAIIGAGGHGKVVAEIAELNNFKPFFFDDAFLKPSYCETWEIMGPSHRLIELKDDFEFAFIAIGNNQIRLEKHLALQKSGFKIPALIHPKAVVSKKVTIDSGTVVMAGATVNPFVKIEEACIINTNSSVDHDCHLESAVHLSPGVNVGGSVSIGKLSWIGIGASIVNNIQIGKEVIVGANCTVLSSVTDFQKITKQLFNNQKRNS